jgi:hypothetical protein
MVMVATVFPEPRVNVTNVPLVTSRRLPRVTFGHVSFKTMKTFSYSGRTQAVELHDRIKASKIGRRGAWSRSQ